MVSVNYIIRWNKILKTFQIQNISKEKDKLGSTDQHDRNSFTKKFYLNKFSQLFADAYIFPFKLL